MALSLDTGYGKEGWRERRSDTTSEWKDMVWNPRSKIRSVG